jgi:hypothetical protein
MTTDSYPREGICALCGLPYTHWGNNPQPCLPNYEQRVCDTCNTLVVIPTRLRDMGVDPSTADAIGQAEEDLRQRQQGTTINGEGGE